MIRTICEFFQDHPTLSLFLLPLLFAAIVGGLLGFSFGGMAHAMGYDNHFWGLVRWTPIVCCCVVLIISLGLWILSHTIHM